ncbi:LOW QUALITY PROTEIN: uncharacterized protein Culd [Panulirus ornatus]|uniref:LOW QUALITY PROTEIN: uncharacterized protein Culd n=1 Tax=Panulirus ornatus TaxID=150431 RepID=UPI003A8934F4
MITILNSRSYCKIPLTQEKCFLYIYIYEKSGGIHHRNMKISKAGRAAVVWVCVLTTAWTEAGPLNIIRGDLCRRLDGRKFYLEADTHALVTASNVSLPEYPRIATRDVHESPSQFPHPPRRHRRENLQEVVDVPERRYGRNVTGLTTSSSLSGPSLAAPSEAVTVMTTLEGQDDYTVQPEGPTPPSGDMGSTTPPEMIEEEDRDMQTVEVDMSNSLTQPFRCGAEFFTCPECHLEFTFQKVNLPSCSHDQSCRCDYVRVREPPYMGGGVGRDVCSSGLDTPIVFTTQTREGILDFLYSRAYLHAFTVSVRAKRNKYHIEGKVNVTHGYIRSPFFPELYPKEHWMEYHLHADEPSARIKVNFLDFQLSPWSFVEVQDTNRSRVAAFNGNVFRPPILVSSGPELTIRFSSNGETARGFNLKYAFVDADSLAIFPAITDCGGFVTNFGGTITMMKMAKDDRNFTMYDCVWIVQPPQNYAFKSHLSIRVVQFEDMVEGTRVEVRQGVTSEDYLLEEVGGVAETSGREHVAALDTGFYVRLKGAFSRDSKLAIVYTSFSYLGSCYTLTDLMCHNHRCIPKMLRCDGFDHCGDSSDEPPSCYGGRGNKSLTPEDAAWWYEHTPNYYFPQKSNLLLGGPHGWSSLLLLVSLIVLVMVIVGLVSYMFRNGIQDTNRALHRERRAMISRRGSLSDGVEIFDASADDPPLYEPPPDYEEVIKLILSGNNLKLVRRPGGVTAWVPDKLANEGSGGERQQTNERPLRTRHASLDLERGMEVVLWNPNNFSPARGGSTMPDSEAGTERNLSAAQVPFFGHFRRSSLPIAPLPEVVQAQVQGHSVSIAPETISEAPEGFETPRRPPPAPPLRPSYTLSSPQLSVRSFTYDTSAVSSAISTPGVTSPQNPRKALRARKNKRLLKKGGGGKKKKKRSSSSSTSSAATARKQDSLEEKQEEEGEEEEDDSAPPSYEAAMQQANHSETHTPRGLDLPSTSEAASQVHESTQTISDSVHTQEMTPTDRLRAARELFQRISRGERQEVDDSSKRPVAKVASKRPGVTVQRTKHTRMGSGGTISRGTVKARKAMLLQAQKHGGECSCNGACSCIHFKPGTSKGDNPHAGGVRAKVHYYSTIEENTKKRESDVSVGTSDVTPEDPEPQLVVEESPEDNSSLTKKKKKKKKLVRNESMPPTLGHARQQRDLDIYFSQCEKTSDPSPLEDMECPLISPVSSSPKPVIVASQDATVNRKETTEEKIIPSIRNRVQMYNDLAKVPANSSLTSLQKSPSPLPSPKAEEEQNYFLQYEATQSSNEGMVDSNCTTSVKTPTCDTPIKPGLVKEATAKFITAFHQEIRPKLQFQDSDEWSEGVDSPLPVRIPYLNLKDENINSPDASDCEKLPVLALKQEEAESIELWDSRSQGKSEWQSENPVNATVEDLPSPASGAVPKRSSLAPKESIKEPAEVREVKSKGSSIVLKLQNRSRGRNAQAKKNLKLNLTGKFLPACDTETAPKPTQNPGDATPLNKTSSEDDLVVMSLATSASPSPSPSGEDSLPPSPLRSWTTPSKATKRDLNETQDEILESDPDEDVTEGTPFVSVQPRSDSQVTTGCSMAVGSPGTSEPKPKMKIPVPSPRGSKAGPNASVKASAGGGVANPAVAASRHLEVSPPSNCSLSFSTAQGIMPSSSSSPSSPPSNCSPTAKIVVPFSPPPNSSSTAEAALPSSSPSNATKANSVVPSSPPENASSTAKSTTPSSPLSSSSATANSPVPFPSPSTSSSSSSSTANPDIPSSPPPPHSSTANLAMPSSPPPPHSTTAKAAVPFPRQSDYPTTTTTTTAKASMSPSPHSTSAPTAKASMSPSPHSTSAPTAKASMSPSPHSTSAPTAKASMSPSPHSTSAPTAKASMSPSPHSTSVSSRPDQRDANHPPTLSPEMARSGIVTIQTGRNLKWDYI